MPAPVEINDLGSIGVVVDTPAYMLPPEAWTQATNMRVVDGGVERLQGWEPIFASILAGNDSFTKVLLQFQGPNAGTTITDTNAGGGAHVWTAAGNAQLNSNKLLLDGTGDWVTTPDSADFTLGSGPFTVEMKFNCTQAGGTARALGGSRAVTSTIASLSWQLYRTAGNVIRCDVGQVGLVSVTGTTQFTDVLNPGDHHVAVTRSGNTLNLWIDGVLEATTALVGSVNDSADVLGVGTIGADVTIAPWKGTIDGFRLSVGTARWLATFSVPTREYLTAAQVQPHFLMPVRTASATFWLYTSLTKAFAFDGVNYGNVTRLVASVDSDYTANGTASWNGTLLSSVPIINNGSDVPQFWNAINLATPLADLTNWTSTLRAKVLRAFGPYLVAIGISKSGTSLPHTVKWSSAASPGSIPSTWNEADPTNDAGETDLPDVSAGILVDLVPMADTMYIFKETSTWKMRFIGGRFIFDFGKAAWLTTIGLLAPRCACVTGDGTRLVWASQDDILWSDGNTVKSLLNEKRRREIFNSIDTTNFVNSFMFTNPPYKEVWFCYPTSGNQHPNRALIMNYMRTDQWPLTDADGITFRNAAIGPIEGASDVTWAADTFTWEEDDGPWSEQTRRRVVAVGTVASKFYNLDKTATRDGVVFTGTLQRKSLGLLGKKRSGEWIVDFNRMKMTDTLWPKVQGGPIAVRFGTQQLVEGPLTWNASVSYDPTERAYCNPGPVSGRALSVEYSGAVPWRLDGYGMEITDLGNF